MESGMESTTAFTEPKETPTGPTEDPSGFSQFQLHSGQQPSRVGANLDDFANQGDLTRPTVDAHDPTAAAGNPAGTSQAWPHEQRASFVRAKEKIKDQGDRGERGNDPPVPPPVPDQPAQPPVPPPVPPPGPDQPAQPAPVPDQPAQPRPAPAPQIQEPENPQWGQMFLQGVLESMNKSTSSKRIPRAIPQSMSRAGGLLTQQQPTIHIKNINRNIINEKARRKKAATKGEKILIVKARREYNSLKQKTKKAITIGKNKSFKQENAKINTLPASERVAARKKLRQKLNQRKSTLLKQLPPSKKMGLKDLKRLVGIARKLRW